MIVYFPSSMQFIGFLRYSSERGNNMNYENGSICTVESITNVSLWIIFNNQRHGFHQIAVGTRTLK